MGEVTAGLRGRQAECRTLERLLTGARAGRSGVLVLRGEAGMGKTALLDHLAARATGCRVERAAGVQSEMELAYAALHQLCAPMLPRLGTLPGPQRDALAKAFGMSGGEPPDRFLVGLAVLTLISGAAGDRPLVWVIDDAQWLDRMSALTLGFVARRLLAESVALVFAIRSDVDHPDLRGLPELPVGGLDDADARALLDTVLDGPVDDRVRDRIIAETRGNPLALLELPRGLTAAELAFGFGRPDSSPLVGRIEDGFRRRLAPLPADTRQLLLTAAVEPVGDVTLLWRALTGLGIGPEAAASAEAAGLIELGTRVRFRHPLVRSAAWHAAGAADLRAAHRALAEATGDLDPDRRAWHRAHAAVGPDERVAAELDRAAGRALGQGGRSVAAAFLERAAELTSDPAVRATRALAAAEARFGSGAPEAVPALLSTAELGPLDALHTARLERLRARVAFARRPGGDAPPLLLAAARRLEPLDPAAARETYLEALGAAIHAGSGERDVARAAPGGAGRPIDLLLDALATRFTAGYPAGVPPLRRALENRPGPHWLWLTAPVAQELWDDAGWHQLTDQAVSQARAAHALAELPAALLHRADADVLDGEFGAAAARIDEAAAISGDARPPPAALLLAAGRGREIEASDLIEAGVKDGIARGEGRLITIAMYAKALLYNGLGQYRAAFDAARRAAGHDDLGLHNTALVELVEAAVRAGEPEAAAEALDRLSARTRAAGTDWALGAEARSRALITTGRQADQHYREALDRLSRTRVRFHLARAHLLYGEWLRRANRRADAREHLRTAHAALGPMGAAGFAERARRELAATGEKVRRRSGGTRADLTAQEAQIARLVAAGHTNPEIAAELYLSPRTVEWHLRKVFGKLGVSSRRELRARPAIPPDAPRT